MRDRATGESIEFEIRRALFRMSMTVLVDTYPWRSALIAGGLLILGVLVGSPLGLLVVLVVASAVLVLELTNTRDFVTRNRIVRQRGIFGRSRFEIPLRDVETVQVVKPIGLEMPGIRDLEVRSATQGVTFLGVADADAISSRILALRDGATGAEGPHNNELQRTRPAQAMEPRR